MSTKANTWGSIGALFVITILLSAGAWYIFVDDKQDVSIDLTKNVNGCMDTNAINFNPDAELDDGSCVFPTATVLGCMNLNATNYNPLAEIDDATCTYATPPVEGCTDVNATNY